MSQIGLLSALASILPFDKIVDMIEEGVNKYKEAKLLNPNTDEKVLYKECFHSVIFFAFSKLTSIDMTPEEMIKHTNDVEKINGLIKENPQ